MKIEQIQRLFRALDYFMYKMSLTFSTMDFLEIQQPKCLSLAIDPLDGNRVFDLCLYPFQSHRLYWDNASKNKQIRILD